MHIRAGDERVALSCAVELFVAQKGWEGRVAQKGGFVLVRRGMVDAVDDELELCKAGITKSAGTGGRDWTRNALSLAQTFRPKSSALDRMSCESMNGFLSWSVALARLSARTIISLRRRFAQKGKTHGHNFCPFGSSYVFGLRADDFLERLVDAEADVLAFDADAPSFSLPEVEGRGREVTTWVTFFEKKLSTDYTSTPSASQSSKPATERTDGNAPLRAS